MHIVQQPVTKCLGCSVHKNVLGFHTISQNNAYFMPGIPNLSMTLYPFSVCTDKQVPLKL